MKSAGKTGVCSEREVLLFLTIFKENDDYGLCCSASVQRKNHEDQGGFSLQVEILEFTCTKLDSTLILWSSIRNLADQQLANQHIQQFFKVVFSHFFLKSQWQRSTRSSPIGQRPLVFANSPAHSALHVTPLTHSNFRKIRVHALQKICTEGREWPGT